MLSTISAAALYTFWRASMRGVFARELRRVALQPRVERGHDAMAGGILRTQRVEQVRREVGQVVRLGP